MPVGRRQDPEELHSETGGREAETEFQVPFLAHCGQPSCCNTHCQSDNPAPRKVTDPTACGCGQGGGTTTRASQRPRSLPGVPMIDVQKTGKSSHWPVHPSFQNPSIPNCLAITCLMLACTLSVAVHHPFDDLPTRVPKKSGRIDIITYPHRSIDMVDQLLHPIHPIHPSSTTTTTFVFFFPTVPNPRA